MQPSRVVAGLAFVGLVPACIYLAYRGAGAGLYPPVAIPVVLGVLLTVSLTALFLGLPALGRLVG